MNLIPTVVEQMQKMTKAELIEAVEEILPKVEVEVQVELIVKLKRLAQKREMSGG